MAQNVTIAGNQYPSVPSVLIPKTGGGGNAIFADPSVVTAVAADVASGKYFLDSSGVITQGTASGGASNIVTGTFTGTTTGAAMDITLNYSGSGYPVAVMIYPSEGVYASNGTFYKLVQRYAMASFVAIKNNINSAPSYPTSSIVNSSTRASLFRAYKNSTSSSTIYDPATNIGSGGIGLYQNLDAEASSTTNGANVVKLRSNTKMSVFIASTSYGFAANIEYTYWVLYSS